jgi:hypothetical protein
MLGIKIDDDQTWQLDKLWRDNYTQYSNAHGLVETTTPNIIMIRPTKTVDGFQIFIRYSK